MAKLPKYLTVKDFLHPKVGVNIGMVHDQLNYRYNKTVSGKVELKYYTTDTSIVVHAKIPSEKNELYVTPIIYDVIIEFKSIIKIEKDTKQVNLKDNFGMRVFSNCPSFTFGFNYLLNKMNALYQGVPKGSYSKEAIRKSPNVINPSKILGTEKSLWFAIKAIQDDTHLNILQINKVAETLPKGVFDNVKSQVEILLKKPVKKKAKVTRTTKSKDVPSAINVNGKRVSLKDTSMKTRGLRNTTLSSNRLTSSSLNRKITTSSINRKMKRSTVGGTSKK